LQCSYSRKTAEIQALASIATGYFIIDESFVSGCFLHDLWSGKQAKNVIGETLIRFLQRR
jgi:hypothetical protein